MTLPVLVLTTAGCLPSLEQYYPDDNPCTAFGPVEVVAEDPAGPGALVLRGAAVFWLDQAPPYGLVMAPKQGGNAVVIVESTREYAPGVPVFPAGRPPRDIGTDGTLVYWVGDNSQGSSIRLWADDAGNIAYATAAEYPEVNRLAVDLNNSYFPFREKILKAPNTEQTVTQLAAGTAPLALAVSPGDVWFTDIDGTVRQIGKGGGAEATVIAEAQGNAYGIAAEASGAFWTTDGGKVAGFLDGAQVTLVEGRNAPTEIAVDDLAVYWVEPATGSVMCVPKVGGEVVTLASDRAGPNDVAVDESGVFWVDKAGGLVMARYR